MGLGGARTGLGALKVRDILRRCQHLKRVCSLALSLVTIETGTLRYNSINKFQSLSNPLSHHQNVSTVTLLLAIHIIPPHCIYSQRKCILLPHNTGCNRRNGPDFKRVFLRSNYTDITQNTYIQSWTFTEILAREKRGFLWCLRTVLVGDVILPYLNWIPMLSLDAAPATLTTGKSLRAYSGWKSMDTCASVFVVLRGLFFSTSDGL